MWTRCSLLHISGFSSFMFCYASGFRTDQQDTVVCHDDPLRDFGIFWGVFSETPGHNWWFFFIEFQSWFGSMIECFTSGGWNHATRLWFWRAGQIQPPFILGLRFELSCITSWSFLGWSKKTVLSEIKRMPPRLVMCDISNIVTCKVRIPSRRHSTYQDVQHLQLCINPLRISSKQQIHLQLWVNYLPIRK